MSRKSKRAINTEELFACVPRLIEEPKYFDVSLDSIEKMFNRRDRIDLRTVHSLAREDGVDEDVTLPLRLRISGVPEHPESWDAALLLYNRRIDGFGHEETFCDISGSEQNGWHRHIWNAKTQEASGKVLALLCDDDGMSFRDFLIRTLKHMKISYLKDEHDYLF